MAFLFILHYLPCSSSIPQLRVKISKEGVDQGVALYASMYANKLKISREYVSMFCSIVLQKVRKQGTLKFLTLRSSIPSFGTQFQ